MSKKRPLISYIYIIVFSVIVLSIIGTALAEIIHEGHNEVYEGIYPTDIYNLNEGWEATAGEKTGL